MTPEICRCAQYYKCSDVYTAMSVPQPVRPKLREAHQHLAGCDVVCVSECQDILRLVLLLLTGAYDLAMGDDHS